MIASLLVEVSRANREKRSGGKLQIKAAQGSFFWWKKTRRFEKCVRRRFRKHCQATVVAKCLVETMLKEESQEG